MTAILIDAFDFCRQKLQRSGEIPVRELPRLAAESVDQSGTVKWTLHGGHNERGHAQLMLSVSGTVQLRCQRCLGPFAFGIASDAALVLAQDEASADELDELLSDEPVEVIVGSRDTNLAVIVEDEALLALPISPRHESCSGQSERIEPEEKKESPFAILKNLKQ